MLIGDKQRFAVEYALDLNSGGEWMYGKLCYWLDGESIGDYELGTSLRDVLSQLKYLLYDSGKRNADGLCLQAPEKVFYQLNEAIYGDSKNVRGEMPDSPARFEITIPVDAFDQWKIFLIDCNGYSTVLYKGIEDQNVRTAQLLLGEYDHVIGKLYKALESIYAHIADS
ncbi:hypothetical protein KFZ76_02595 [Methylovulum psychrotolerans]|uniref:Imm42 family immunity protein n=1 Tax=Methylovulum psychrotolerans TaxID=1704499 RepID=UPI001BFFC122|nr:Imm42 family immunity protein [Methylovulum psychrotolerans]MBT9096600.1 hypothetical protein [Methylovulum psychrotolerans]